MKKKFFLIINNCVFLIIKNLKFWRFLKKNFFLIIKNLKILAFFEKNFFLLYNDDYYLKIKFNFSKDIFFE
ncbi:MAG: hypothetical protein B6I24_01290 [Bacteroidetes bacterium 4572_128]|nr:MAG: hypothetical protein B6I24_01290 [Bacteroidetes bacterium 4572_128]